MNAVEHIVECYFRQCKECFTMTDVKIRGGNNRQCDLLAYNVATQEQYHIEVSVTHGMNWIPRTKELLIERLRETFDKKFRGTPQKREGERTDFTKGKIYLEKILQTYRDMGFEPSKVKRIFVT